jgi:glutathionylspermidine synthase
MRRIALTPRPDWIARLAGLGMDLEESPTSPYWREDAAYAFRAAEIETLHSTGETLVGMIEAATAHVVETGRFAALGIPPNLAELAARSWRAREPSLYGRFDLRFDGSGPPKLLEYNADTPTALFEASVVQWHWLEERFPGADQYNSIHEGLIEAWNGWRRQGRLGRVHFACMPDDDDDLLTTAYLQDTALQAGLDGHLLGVPDIGWNGRQFLDLASSRIEALFKLYPWDWMAEERFFPHLAASRVKVLEPAWRVIPASKGILAILWEMFPGHPNLLPAHFDPSRLDGPLILKPLLGREGANMIVDADGARTQTDGPYAAMPTVAQALSPLPELDGWRPVIGLWTIEGDPRGIGVREDRHLVTGRGARFVPHMIER